MHMPIGGGARQAILRIADQRLATISLQLAPPVCVLGDASDSMDVAIRVSCVVAGLVSNLVDNARLRYLFYSYLFTLIYPMLNIFKILFLFFNFFLLIMASFPCLGCSMMKLLTLMCPTMQPLSLTWRCAPKLVD